MIWFSILWILVAVFSFIMKRKMAESTKETPPRDGHPLDLRAWSIRKYKGAILTYSFFASSVLAVLCFVFSILTVVPAGHVGVPVIFGSVQELSLREGLNFVNPFAKVVKMDARTRTYTMVSSATEGAKQGDDSIFAQSSDGVIMSMDVTVAFKLSEVDAPLIYRYLGENYAEELIRPAAKTSVPDITSKFTFQEAYATKRDLLAEKIVERMADRIKGILSKYSNFTGSGVTIQQVFTRKIEPPKVIKLAIEEKMAAEQASQRMKFILDKERQEADRKRVEAKGIKDFQDIVRQGIDEQLLKWKGIEATEALAKSNNTKIVVIGGGKTGLPLILNTDSSGEVKK